jgi:hypothetical protein
MKYLVIYNGKVRDVLVKDKPLLSSDIVGYFDQVLIDTSDSYKEFDNFVFEEFVARQDVVVKLKLTNVVDVERYRR